MSGMKKSDFSRLLGTIYPVLSLAYLLLIYGLPILVCMLVWSETGARWRWAALLVWPLLYAAAFAVTAGVLSISHHKGIVPGKFSRNVAHRVYFHRRLYGLCWTARICSMSSRTVRGSITTRSSRFAKFSKLRMKFGDPIYDLGTADLKSTEEMTAILQTSIAKLLRELRALNDVSGSAAARGVQFHQN